MVNGNITVKDVAINYTRQDFLTNPNVQAAALNKNDDFNRVFKRDLLMFATGDLFAEDPLLSNRDLRGVAYVYNYAQQITHRLMTDRGTLPEDRTFGVPWSKYIGSMYASSSAVMVNLRQDIEGEIMRDKRTASVNQLDVVFLDPNTIKVDISITPITANEAVLLGFTVMKA